MDSGGVEDSDTWDLAVQQAFDWNRHQLVLGAGYRTVQSRYVAAPGGDTRQVVDKLHRIDPAIVRADFEKAGFVLEESSDLLRNPADDHSLLVFDEKIRGKTDRFMFRFRKPQ